MDKKLRKIVKRIEANGPVVGPGREAHQGAGCRRQHAVLASEHAFRQHLAGTATDGAAEARPHRMSTFSLEIVTVPGSADPAFLERRDEIAYALSEFVNLALGAERRRVALGVLRRRGAGAGHSGGSRAAGVLRRGGTGRPSPRCDPNLCGHCSVGPRPCYCLNRHAGGRCSRASWAFSASARRDLGCRDRSLRDRGIDRAPPRRRVPFGRRARRAAILQGDLWLPCCAVRAGAAPNGQRACVSIEGQPLC